MTPHTYRDTTSQPVRVPHWLDKQQRAELAAEIKAALHRRANHPTTAQHLHAVLTELSVVSAREQVWPTPTTLVRRVNGYPSDALPIRISGEELSAVLALPDLPPSVRRSLPQE